MDMHWTTYLQRDGGHEQVPLARFFRPLQGATLSDFGLSMSEGKILLASLQRAVVQDQIRPYDVQRRCCRHCGQYRRIKDWRPRIFATALGSVMVRVPQSFPVCAPLSRWTKMMIRQICDSPSVRYRACYRDAAHRSFRTFAPSKGRLFRTDPLRATLQTSPGCKCYRTPPFAKRL